jgi:hypothetical protein
MKKTRRWVFAMLALALALPLVGGCSGSIGAVAPLPNTALVPQRKSLDLALAPEVADGFSLGIGSYTLDVQSWHRTLENGFQTGFRSAYPAKQGASADMTLRIDKAVLEIGDFDHARARVQFAATLVGADGTIRRSAGVVSRGAPMFAGGAAMVEELIAADVAASVAAMYEQIARDLFTEPQPAARTMSCVPGQSVACVGARGCQGYQVCASDGARYEACSCGN